MSRVGQKPISIPKGVDVQVADLSVTVKGPKGAVVTPILAGITVEKKDGLVRLARGGDEKKDKALHGLNRALLQNAVLG
ncbi:MAG TPA: 50S ribosomal protein L6, partial [Thermoanaerobaculia bacterium]|nr:50S ribosomal protein L6 [Thermoanaerobaculia bacterium]